ncbi:MAG: putative sensor protein [Frankiales bacterium]|nr:putative sensor protein [Frankiales bacterium]
MATPADRSRSADSRKDGTVPELLCERAITLPADPTSARAARRFVRDVLVECGRAEWTDRAELAVSELVTNAIVHAHTALTLAVIVSAQDVTVAVRDHSPLLPAQRYWGETATTGRGLSLVASLSVTYGVDAEADGKTVWFRLDDTLSEDAYDAYDTYDATAAVGHDSWDIAGLLQELEGTGAAPVVLPHLPVLLWLSAQQHQEAVLRELFLMQAESNPETVHLGLAAAGRALASLSAAVDRGVADAIASGAQLFGLPSAHPSPLPAVPATVDAPVAVTVDGHADFSALQDALDAGWRLGAADRMLIRPALPEIVALRDWACEQVLAQVNGVPATPWSGVDHPRFVDPASARDTAPAPDWDDSIVRETDKAVVAADDNNRLVAVSAAAAALLGWTAGELTGRRVVTIVPERLREAHVAGFTRHLTTGEAHVIGVPLTLPVLRRDGTEVICRLLVERAAAGTGRAVYLAWLTPEE